MLSHIPYFNDLLERPSDVEDLASNFYLRLLFSVFYIVVLGKAATA